MNMSIRRSIGRQESLTPKQAGLIGLAAAATATAVWVEFQSRRAERENPPKGKYLYIDGVRLHYVMRGEGPPVLLVHGNTVTLADFEASGLIDRLAQDHRVIAFDRPGYGHSSRPRNRLWTPTAQAALLRKALAGLGIDKPVVVGHSLGTMVALAMALNFPAAVSRLVLVGGYYYPSARLDVALTAPAALPLVGDAMRYTTTALLARAGLDRAAKRMFAPNDVPAGFFTTLSREMMLRPLQLRANAEDSAFMIPQAQALARRYRELRLPVTLIAGAEDKIVDVEGQTRRLHEELPHGRLLVVAHAGHMVHYAAQEEIVAAAAAPPVQPPQVQAVKPDASRPMASFQAELNPSRT